MKYNRKINYVRNGFENMAKWYEPCGNMSKSVKLDRMLQRGESEAIPAVDAD